MSRVESLEKKGISPARKKRSAVGMSENKQREAQAGRGDLAESGKLKLTANQFLMQVGTYVQFGGGPWKNNAWSRGDAKPAKKTNELTGFQGQESIMLNQFLSKLRGSTDKRIRS